MVLNGPGYRPKYRGPSNGLSWTIEGKKKEMPDKLTVTFLPIYRVLSFLFQAFSLLMMDYKADRKVRDFSGKQLCLILKLQLINYNVQDLEGNSKLFSMWTTVS